jgi:hypothetical protein
MLKAELYLHLLHTKPQAFLLLSHFHLECIVEKRVTFLYFLKNLQIPGHRKVLHKEQVRKNLKFLEERGYLSIKKPPHRKPLMEITILHEGFLYE